MSPFALCVDEKKEIQYCQNIATTSEHYDIRNILLQNTTHITGTLLSVGVHCLLIDSDAWLVQSHYWLCL